MRTRFFFALCRTFANAIRNAPRLKAAAQHSSSELGSALALHFNCPENEKHLARVRVQVKSKKVKNGVPFQGRNYTNHIKKKFVRFLAAGDSIQKLCFKKKYYDYTNRISNDKGQRAADDFAGNC